MPTALLAALTEQPLQHLVLLHEAHLLPEVRVLDHEPVHQLAALSHGRVLRAHVWARGPMEVEIQSPGALQKHQEKSPEFHTLGLPQPCDVALKAAVPRGHEGAEGRGREGG